MILYSSLLVDFSFFHNLLIDLWQIFPAVSGPFIVQYLGLYELQARPEGSSVMGKDA